MQSSAMVAIRTMIMITCLVAVPLAAVFGTALPKVVKSAFGGRGQSFTWNPGPTTGDDTTPPSVLTVDEFNPHTEAVPRPSSELAMASETRLPTAHITGVRAVDDAVAAQPNVETAPLWNPPPRTARAAKGRDMTAHFAPAPLAHRVDEPPSHHDLRSETLQKTVYSQPHREPLVAEAADDEPADDAGHDRDQLVPVAPRRAGNSDNALTDGEKRLRQLGATYYRLETWGSESNLYRCCSNIALSPGSRATRHFEAIEAAPSQAIAAVIKQVDAWRAKRTERRRD